LRLKLHFSLRGLAALVVLVMSSGAVASAVNSNQAKPAKGHTSAQPPKTTQSEVREALVRSFGQTVIVDPAAVPAFFEGDFNGDHSLDLAVVVKLNSVMLAAINDPLSNWIIEEPDKAVLPDPTKRVQKLPSKPPRPAIVLGENLLAIVHGFGTLGWRDPQARQGYILKNGDAHDLVRMPRTSIHRPAKDPRFPRLQGDVIREVLSGRNGFIYWAGSQYAFQPQPNSR
jgi:hypothetical protein